MKFNLKFLSRELNWENRKTNGVHNLGMEKLVHPNWEYGKCVVTRIQVTNENVWGFHWMV